MPRPSAPGSMRIAPPRSLGPAAQIRQAALGARLGNAATVVGDAQHQLVFLSARISTSTSVARRRAARRSTAPHPRSRAGAARRRRAPRSRRSLDPQPRREASAANVVGSTILQDVGAQARRPLLAEISSENIVLRISSIVSSRSALMSASCLGTAPGRSSSASAPAAVRGRTAAGSPRRAGHGRCGCDPRAQSAAAGRPRRARTRASAPRVRRRPAPSRRRAA